MSEMKPFPVTVGTRIVPNGDNFTVALLFEGLPADILAMKLAENLQTMAQEALEKTIKEIDERSYMMLTQSKAESENMISQYENGKLN